MASGTNALPGAILACGVQVDHSDTCSVPDTAASDGKVR